MSFILKAWSRMCGIDLLKRPKRILIKQEDESGRSLQEADWEPLRIHLDFSFIENNVGSKFKMQDFIDLKEKIMPKTQEVFQKLLKVKRNKGKLKLLSQTCEEFQVPELYSEHGEGVDADLVIFVMIDETGFFLQNHVEAAAIHCLQHSETRRPIAGYIQFKPDLQVTNSTAVDYMVWLALHEITHILVFNDALYEDWLNPATLQPRGLENVVTSKVLPNGKKMNLLKTPKMLEKGREHFGCKHFDGVPLEYNGGPGTAGAHWAKKYMNTDYMIGDSYGENLISDITLAMFEDSGWYQPKYELANLFLWGKKKGCEFTNHNSKCVETSDSKVNTRFNDEFCTNINYPICSVSHTFRGNCRARRYRNPLNIYERYFSDPSLGGVDQLTDKCPIAIEVKKGQNYYGGSCRVGHKRELDSLERVCPECACFMSNLRIERNYRKVEEVQKTTSKLRFKMKNNNNTNTIQPPNQNISNNTVNNGTFTEEKTPNTALNKKNLNFLNAIDPLPELTSDDLRAQCYDFKCKESVLYVVLNGNEYKCNTSGQTTIEGYSGGVTCPSSEELCHPKFKCKFGCVEMYDNEKAFSSFK
jgi:hypothetical protein